VERNITGAIFYHSWQSKLQSCKSLSACDNKVGVGKHHAMDIHTNLRKHCATKQYSSHPMKGGPNSKPNKAKQSRANNFSFCKSTKAIFCTFMAYASTVIYVSEAKNKRVSAN